MSQYSEILKKLGIVSLNQMQKDVSRECRESNRDMVILSPTGSGKTLAYLLPLQEQIDRDDINVQMLVVTPGRELALQSSDVLKNMRCGVRGMACYGGRPAMEEHRKMRELNPQVIFATPGRLLDHLEKGNILCDNVSFLVIDEFDKCLEMGFAREMTAIIGFLDDKCRRFLISATDIDSIPNYVNMGRTKRLSFLNPQQQTVDRIETFFVRSEQKDKLPLLALLLTEVGSQSSIVFLNYRDSVERVSEYLRQNAFPHVVFHGGLEQRQREYALHQFSNGSANVMVCTDLASRGLDIPSIGNIIHYHLPLAESEYIHRVGRTARWDAKGNTFFLIGPEETIPGFIDVKPEEYVVKTATPYPVMPTMATLYIGKGKKDKISKGDIVGFLCKIGGLNSDDIGRIDIYDRYVYVAVNRKKCTSVLKNTAGAKIKGQRTVVEICCLVG